MSTLMNQVIYIYITVSGVRRTFVELGSHGAWECCAWCWPCFFFLCHFPMSYPQSLAHRLLFPQRAAVDLPPLLATPTIPQDLHNELYDFIALALRAYVNPWWTKITRYDRDLLPQTTHTLTTVVRVLEARALALDLPALVFHDVPSIIIQHYRDYRSAQSKLFSSYAIGGAASLPQLFHHLQPHIALSSDGTLNLEYYRQIVDHVLKACLPPEDYAPEVERAIVREVVVKVLVEHGNDTRLASMLK